MKTLTIKTAEAIIYLANGKVMQVRSPKTGRFMKVAKFANIVNNLIAVAKPTFEACLNTSLIENYTLATKLLMNKFKSLAKMAKALLGNVTIVVGRNYHVQGFDLNTLALHS